MLDCNKKIPGVLIALLGVLIFGIFGFVLTKDNLPYWEQKVPLKHWGMSDFDLGQYYFNHDDNPAGPYDLKKAQFFYERALSKNPKAHMLLWYQSGRVDFINGDFDIALQKFDTQRKYFGDEIPNVYYMIGLTYGYKARKTGDPHDWQKAEEGFNRALDFFYEAPWPYVDLAWVYFSQGKYEAMIPVLERGLGYEANNPWLLNMYGLALLNTNDRKLAREYFLFAQEEAAKLTVTDWGKSYPGNNPELWDDGLSEFRSLISKNVALTEVQ